MPLRRHHLGRTAAGILRLMTPAEIRSASQRARFAALPVCPECGKVRLATKAARAAGRCAKCKRVRPSG